MTPGELEDIAATLAGGLTPPEILRRLGYRVLHCKARTNEFASSNTRTRTLVLLVSGSIQDAWHALLHEAMEVEMARYFGPGHEDLMERASRAMSVDRQRFREAVREFGPDIARLQTVFEYAPPTQLALRLTDLFDNCSAASWLMEEGMLSQEARITCPALDALPEAPWVEEATLQAVYARHPTNSVLHRARVVGRGWRIRTWGPRHCLVVTHHRRAFG